MPSASAAATVRRRNRRDSTHAGTDSGHTRDAGFADGGTSNGGDVDAGHGASPDASLNETDDGIIEGGGCSSSPVGPDATGLLGVLGALMMFARGRRKK